MARGVHAVSWPPSGCAHCGCAALRVLCVAPVCCIYKRGIFVQPHCIADVDPCLPHLPLMHGSSMPAPASHRPVLHSALAGAHLLARDQAHYYPRKLLADFPLTSLNQQGDELPAMLPKGCYPNPSCSRSPLAVTLASSNVWVAC